MGRLAGYGIGLMFIAGYALLYSNLTLMVVLGLMLLTMDRYRRDAMEPVATADAPVLDQLVGGHV
jgi:energy-converting hydrogenase Eha subunit A